VRKRAPGAFEEVKAEEADELQTVLPKTDVFRKVVYTGKVPYLQVWQPQFSATEGVFVCISKHTPFLSRSSQSHVRRKRRTSFARRPLIFAVALGESNAKDNLDDVDPELLNRVFKKFHLNIGSWLNNWTAENTNFLDRQ